MQSKNLAARAGRWSAQHRKTAIFGWILFVVLATVLGGKVGQNDLDDSARGSGESKRGDMIVKAAGFPDRTGEQVLVQGKDADHPHVTAAVRDVVSRLDRIEGVTAIQRPLVSKDGRSTLVNFELAGTDEQAEKLVAKPLAAVAAAQAAHPGVRVEQFGDASAAKAIAAQDKKDGKKSENISFALLLIILLVAFGALVAAGLPLVLGATAVAGTVGLLGPVSQLYALPPDVAELVIIIGLAVGVDYAMFYSRRMLEERDRGHSAEAAVEIAAATSGRAVLISGLTVMVAMAGLLFAGNPIFVGFGIGTMLVVAVAMLGSLTFLPAMLSFLGEKNWLEKGRVPYVTKRRHKAKGESRVWGAILTRVLKRPLASTLIAGGLLVALCIPALGIQFKEPGFDGYSRSQPVIQTYDRLQAAFPGGAIPATTVIKAEGRHGRAGRRRDPAAPRPGAGHRRALRALRRRDQPRQDRRRRRAVGQGQRHRRRVRALARDAALRGRPGHGRQAGRRRGRRDRRDRRLEGLRRRPRVTRADRVPVRARPRVHPAAAHVPLDRRADQGDRPQPAVGRRGLRRARARLPGRPRREAARLPVGRRHRALDPAVPVRDPVRAVDGLPRVHPQPHPRGRGPRHEQRRRGRARHQEHRRRRDQRRARDGRRVRLLRARQRPARQADRRRPRRRDPDRRDDHPRASCCRPR